jgi:hypothetical protein
VDGIPGEDGQPAFSRGTLSSHFQSFGCNQKRSSSIKCWYKEQKRDSGAGSCFFDKNNVNKVKRTKEETF